MTVMQAGRSMGAVVRRSRNLRLVYHPCVDGAPACNPRMRFAPGSLRDLDDVPRDERCFAEPCQRVWKQVDRAAERPGMTRRQREIWGPALEGLEALASVESQLRGTAPDLADIVHGMRAMLIREANVELAERGGETIPEMRS